MIEHRFDAILQGFIDQSARHSIAETVSPRIQIINTLASTFAPVPPRRLPSRHSERWWCALCIIQVDAHRTLKSRQFIETSFLLREDRQRLTDDESLLGAGLIVSTGILELVSYLEAQFGVVVGCHEEHADAL